MSLRLGVNVDHVATLRNARGEAYPDPLDAARMAIAAGADGILATARRSCCAVPGAQPAGVAPPCRVQQHSGCSAERE